MNSLYKFKTKFLALGSGISFLTAAAATLSSCSHGPAVQEFPETASPREELTKLDADLNTASSNQVNVLSPHNFGEAEQSFKDAKKDLDSQDDAKDVLHSIAQGRAYLNRANEFAQVAHTNMEEVINARKLALTAGAPTHVSADFKKADEDLRDVTSEIEENNVNGAIKNRTALQLKYMDLELRAIKQAKLGEAADKIAQARSEGAKEYAPQTLAIADKSMTDALAFITANRHDAQVDARADEAKKSAEHALMITREARSGKKTSSEELALKMEAERNNSADKQKQLSREQKTVQALAAENSSLESEQAFNRRFEEARKQFTESEAEVYKQGNTLLIRLKGLEFPVAQAVLTANNFPLLAKVQKVIKDFGSNTTVVVEGHTDSNGGKALNERLSAQRADAVKGYLVSNSPDQNLDVKAVGYGYQKPLATNKTASGRAQNRRVDVLIEPTSTHL